jgi:hypothetical protein
MKTLTIYNLYFNSQQAKRCKMQIIQDLVPTNVNMYRVATGKKKRKALAKNGLVTVFKGTVARDFRPSVFFVNQSPLEP